MAQMARRSLKRRERTGVASADAASRVPEIQVVRDAEEVFRAAILAGVLSAERADRNWAGHYLYMFHDENGTGWFRHRDTRAWVSMTARQRTAGYEA